MRHLCQYGNCTINFDSGEGVVVSGAGFRRRFCGWGHATLWCNEKSGRYEQVIKSVIPTVYLGGTGGDNLYERYSDVLGQLTKLMHTMRELVTPHPRDYPDKDYSLAMQIFQQQFRLLEDLHVTFNIVRERIVEQMDAQKVQRGNQ